MESRTALKRIFNKSFSRVQVIDLTRLFNCALIIVTGIDAFLDVKRDGARTPPLKYNEPQEVKKGGDCMSIKDIDKTIAFLLVVRQVLRFANRI